MKAHGLRPTVVLALGVVVFASGFLLQHAVASDQNESAPANEGRPALGGWPEDANGDGVISDSGAERIPELITTVGDNGVEGYTRYEDLEGPEPANPQQALEMSGEKRTIPLYASDGVTVIGSYTIQPGIMSEASESSDASPSAEG